MALHPVEKPFGKRRLIWLSCLLAVLLTVNGFGRWYGQEQSVVAQQPVVQSKVKGVWLNYMEFAALMNQCSREQYQANVDTLIYNLERAGLNTLFVHLRSHSDSLYPSSLFPWSVQVNGGEGVDYDPLAILIEKAHAKNIRVHGWVNPYRISSGGLSQLPSAHPAVLLKQTYADAVVETQKGVYYNPAHEKVRELILDGIEEIVTRYRVDGIQYDDYFYPTSDTAFDAQSYQQYCSTTPYPLSLADYRITQVNLLIWATYKKVHRQQGMVFGVSPGAGITNNKEELFADVQAWVQGGYVDYLCPQLYFGFSYPLEEFRFDSLLTRWQQLAGKVPLYIGIASYKLGQEDAGSTEWVTATDILARQAEDSAHTQGVCFYHYSSLFGESEQSQRALSQLKTVLEGLS